MQIVKTLKLYRQKTEEQCFYQTVPFAKAKNEDLSRNKNLGGY